MPWDLLKMLDYPDDIFEACTTLFLEAVDRLIIRYVRGRSRKPSIYVS